ncbi:MAG: hypothetical protein HY795_14620 [Desulfovibrio sp.]|nr:hypothetical protein [Desulfovibrio sp.]MBI4961003.1 hypothetical protein [Desulfovibrio sp.]
MDQVKDSNASVEITPGLNPRTESTSRPPVKPTNDLSFDLSDRAERIRRNLLVFSSIGIFFSNFNIVIQNINYYGVTFQNLNNTILYSAILALTLYEFINYITTYFYERYNDIRKQLISLADEKLYSQHSTAVNEELKSLRNKSKYIFSFKTIGLDFIVPVGAGAVCIYICLSKV